MTSPAKLVRDSAGHQLGAEALARHRIGWDCHPTLAPSQLEPSVTVSWDGVPVDIDMTGRLAERAMFHSIGRKLVNGQRQDFSGFGGQRDRWSRYVHVRLVGTVDQQLVMHQCCEIDAGIRPASQKG